MAWTDLAAATAGMKLTAAFLNTIRNNFKAIGDPWTDYTPTVTPATGAITAKTLNSCRYRQNGKTIDFEFDLTITTAGTGAGFLNVTLPVAPLKNGVGSGVNLSAGGKANNLILRAGNSTAQIADYANATVIATGARIVCSATYEAA